VLVHGVAEDGRVWQPQLADLGDEFTGRVLGPPGAGRSSDVPVDFGLADHANCLAKLIEALVLGPAHVAGSPGAARLHRSSSVSIPGWSRR
jgi:pimeloyl-ACP methyl ester carboxylesterase